ncbi:MAG: type II toxin-antitoxin system PemK/MazF family toxin [Acidobacteriota bacterium]
MIHRGGVYEADFPGAGPHPAVVLTREEAIPVLSSVTIALVTSTRRGHPAEVTLAGEHLDLHEESVVNCDDLATLPKRMLGRSRGYLSADQLADLDRALKVALDLG